jgi:hypothetical protein
MAPGAKAVTLRVTTEPATVIDVTGLFEPPVETVKLAVLGRLVEYR